MFKLLLPIFVGLFFLFSAAPTYAINLEGEWLVGNIKLKAEQAGNTFSLIVIDPKVPKKYLGIAELKGTINGNTFTGQAFVVARGCPNLDGYKPASGTISNRKIEVKTILHRYDPVACTRDPGTETEASDTYTKVLTRQEQALDDYQNQLDQLGQDFANRSGPVVDLSKAEVVKTSPIEKGEKFPVYVAGAEYVQQQADIMNMNMITNQPNVSAPNLNPEIARVSNFEGNITRHSTKNGQTSDYQLNKSGTSIKGNVLHAGDSVSFKGEGFIEYISIDGSARRIMTAGYAKEHGYADQIKPGQAGVEIILKPAEPIVPIPAPKEPGAIQKFFNWLGELLTPEPQPTPYGIVGVKG